MPCTTVHCCAQYCTPSLRCAPTIVLGPDGKAAVANVSGHTESIFSCCYSPFGKEIASSSGDQTIRLWNARNGRKISTLKGHTGSVFSVCFSSGCPVPEAL